MKQNGTIVKNDHKKCKNSYISTIETPPGTPRVSKDAPEFTKIEYGVLHANMELNLNKIQKTKQEKKTFGILFTTVVFVFSVCNLLQFIIKLVIVPHSPSESWKRLHLK